MKKSVTINNFGQITIPENMRKTLGIKANDEFTIEETEKGLLMRPVLIERYTEKRIEEFSSDENALMEMAGCLKSKQNAPNKENTRNKAKQHVSDNFLRNEKKNGPSDY